MSRVSGRPPVYDILPLLPRGQAWRDDGLCGKHPMPWLWDGSLDGECETRKERAYRHDIAIAICGHCPVQDDCSSAVDYRLDEGVRAGVVLSDIHLVRNRRSA